MKLVIITDTHFGIKNGTEIFLDHKKRFFDEVFFPYCSEHGITKILHLGDFFDNRKVLNIKVLKHVRDLLDKLREYGMTMDIIPGNPSVMNCSTY